MVGREFNIGEWAVGGVIAVTINDDGAITVAAKHYKTRELIKSKKIMPCWNQPDKVLDFLQELTSDFYVDKIMNWIKGKRWKKMT